MQPGRERMQRVRHEDREWELAGAARIASTLSDPLNDRRPLACLSKLLPILKQRAFLRFIVVSATTRPFHPYCPAPSLRSLSSRPLTAIFFPSAVHLHPFCEAVSFDVLFKVLFEALFDFPLRLTVNPRRFGPVSSSSNDRRRPAPLSTSYRLPKRTTVHIFRGTIRKSRHLSRVFTPNDVEFERRNGPSDAQVATALLYRS